MDLFQTVTCNKLYTIFFKCQFLDSLVRVVQFEHHPCKSGSLLLAHLAVIQLADLAQPLRVILCRNVVGHSRQLLQPLSESGAKYFRLPPRGTSSFAGDRRRLRVVFFLVELDLGLSHLSPPDTRKLLTRRRRDGDSFYSLEQARV